MAEAPLTLERVLYADLARDEALAGRLGVGPEQRACLLGHPQVRLEDPAVLYLAREGEVLARIGLFGGRLAANGRELRMTWGTSWGVHPQAHIGGAAGVLLVRAIREAGTFGGWGISQVAFPIYRAARFETATLERRMLVLRSLPVLRQRLRAAAAARAAAIPVDALLWLARRGLALRLSARGHRVERVERFGPEVDELEARAATGPRFLRDHVELDWALAHPWHGAHERGRYVALVARGAGGALTGYALVRTRFFPTASTAGYRDLTLGSLLRFTATPGEPRAAEALLAGVLQALEAERVDAIEVCSRQPALLALARRMGMLRVGELRVGMKFGPEVRAALGEAGKGLADFWAHMGEGDVLFT